MNSGAAVVDRAIAELLAASLPPHLRGAVGPKRVKEWIERHLDTYAEDKLRLPWCNWLACDNWELPTFFVALILKHDAFELFCGTGYWPEVRHFGERELKGVAASEWHREWSARFEVPCPPLVLGRAAVKDWLGREWE